MFKINMMDVILCALFAFVAMYAGMHALESIREMPILSSIVILACLAQLYVCGSYLSGLLEGSK